MESEVINCPICDGNFARKVTYRHCSNCVVCTGCEVYYCPYCDERVEIIPRKPMPAINNGDGKKT